MLFASASFVLFLIVFICLYYMLPKKWQSAVLLAGSYFFYYFAGIYCLLFIVLTTLITYFFGVWIDAHIEKEKQYQASLNTENDKSERKKYREKAKKSRFRILCFGLFLDFSILAVLKYGAFALEGINGIISLLGHKGDLKLGFIIIPLGISFYIFQSASYLIDVYRTKAKAEHNVFKFALFVSYFPQLVQGPISRYNDLAPELFSYHYYNSENIMSGGIRVAFGYFKKLVIADRILIPVKAIVSDSATYGGAYVLLLVILYSIEIYADFTGGMDITIGISKMLGIKLTENFKRPFSSGSVKEYWRRWHITMGSWFTDYVFYPLSVCKPMQKLSKASRKRLGKTLGKRVPVYLATAVTWFLTGLWHGAGWNFIVWGMLNCAVILISQEFTPLYEKFHKTFPKLQSSSVYGAFMAGRTFLLMGVIRILDVYRDVPLTFKMFGSMFSDFAGVSFSETALKGLGIGVYDVVVIVVGVIIMYAVSKLNEKIETSGLDERGMIIRVSDKIAMHPVILTALFSVLVFSTVVFGVYGFGYDSSDFIYRQF